MNTLLKSKLKQIKFSRGYYTASILDLVNFEYKWKPTECPNCKSNKQNFVIPPFGEFEILCIDCLKIKELKFSHDTNHGIVSHSSVPDDMPKEYNVRAHMPLEAVNKLLDTPGFTTIQGRVWLDHCNDFMNFIGIWEPENFTLASENTGKELFLEMTDENSNHLWSMFELGENETDVEWEDVNYYAFECTKCKCKRGYWDMG